MPPGCGWRRGTATGRGSAGRRATAAAAQPAADRSTAQAVAGQRRRLAICLAVAHRIDRPECLVAPARHHVGEEALVLDIRRPIAGEGCRGAARQGRGRQHVEIDAGRQGHAFAEGDGLAGAHRRHEFEQARCCIGNAGLEDLLVALIGQAHRENRVALRQDGRVELGRPLRDDASETPYFRPSLAMRDIARFVGSNPASCRSGT